MSGYVQHPPSTFQFTQRTCVGGGSSATQSAQRSSIQLRPSLRASILISTPTGDLEERLLGPTAYIRLPTAAATKAGKPWLRAPLSVLGQRAGLNLPRLFREVQDLGGGKQLRLLAQSRTLQPIGVVTINGQRVFGYRGTFTLADISRSTGLSRDLVAQLRSLLSKVGASGETVSYYVTRAGKPVRVVTVLPSSSRGPISTIQDLSAAGGPVQVAAPPAGQTVSLQDLQRRRAG